MSGNDKKPAKSSPMDQVPEIYSLKGWGELAMRSKIIPSSMNVYQAMAAVQVGKEMGLPPFQAVRAVSFINGVPTMSVQSQLAIARKKIGITVVKEEITPEYVEVHLKRPNEDCVFVGRFDLEEAKKITTNKERTKYLIDKDNWRNYPQDMMLWRAYGRALRRAAPEIVFGIYSPEEAESFYDSKEPKVIEAEVGVPDSAVSASFPADPEVVDEEGESTASPSGAEEQDQPQSKPPGYYQFLQKMELAKAAVGEKIYYSVLNLLGYKKSNEVLDSKHMEEILGMMREAVRKINQSSEEKGVVGQEEEKQGE